MKLKYYLRGIGIGIVVTTIIFMISISIHKNDIEPQNTAIQNTESKTVAEAEKSTELATETETKNTEVADTKKANAEEKDSQALASQQNSDAEKTASKTKEAKESTKQAQNKKNTAEEKKKPDKKKNDKKDNKKKNAETNSADKEKVRFEIAGGEFSDVICRKLVEAGLVDDAEAFNTFLVQKNYDNFILPGVYDIPKDSTYEEIAVLLTTKVDGEAAE